MNSKLLKNELKTLGVIMKIDEPDNQSNIDLDKLNSLKNEFSNLDNDEEFNQTLKILKAIGDPNRIKILYLLKSRNLYVYEIMNALDKPKNTISNHLEVLKNAGLIEGQKEGVLVSYSLKKSEILDLLDYLLKPSKTG